MKQENPTPDNAFETIAKNFTGDSGMNINLLKEAINMKYCKILTATKEQTAESVFTADAVWSLGYKHPTAGWSAMAKVPEDNPRLVQFRTVESGGTVHNFTLQLGREFFYKGAITNSTFFYGADTLCAVENKPYEVCLLICGYTYSNYYSSSTSSSTSSMYTPWRIWAVFDIRTGENKASSVAYTSGSGSSCSPSASRRRKG